MLARRGFLHVENIFGRQRRHRALQPAAIEQVIWIGSKYKTPGLVPKVYMYISTDGWNIQRCTAQRSGLRADSQFAPPRFKGLNSHKTSWNDIGRCCTPSMIPVLIWFVFIVPGFKRNSSAYTVYHMPLASISPIGE